MLNHVIGRRNVASRPKWIVEGTVDFLQCARALKSLLFVFLELILLGAVLIATYTLTFSPFASIFGRSLYETSTHAALLKPLK